MIAVAQPAARPWDGQRILRFLTGLAVLALAVTLRLPGPDPVARSAVPPPAVAGVALDAEPAASTGSVAAPADEELPEPVVAPAPVMASAPVVAPASGSVTFTTRLLAGETLGEIPGTPGSRAPPAR